MHETRLTAGSAQVAKKTVSFFGDLSAMNGGVRSCPNVLITIASFTRPPLPRPVDRRILFFIRKSLELRSSAKMTVLIFFRGAGDCSPPLTAQRTQLQSVN